jgi:hypothetical protein
MQLVGIDIAAGAFPVSLLFLKDDGGNHRRSVTPDDDIADLPRATQATIRAHWAAMDLGEWEAIARPPAPPVTPAEIKGEAERRILSRLPEWKQRNLTARGVELVLARVVNGSWTKAQADEAAAMQAAWDRVKAIRSRSDELEQTLPGDFAANRNWPT